MAEENTETEITLSFNVEDGTCVADANSYLTLEEANQYMKNKNRSDWLALSDDEKKSYLISGTQYVDKLFTWKGIKKYRRNQCLSFPRVRLFDLDGSEVLGIPREIKEAVCEAAFYSYQASLEESELFQTYDENGAVKRQKVDGAVEVEYFNTSETAIEYISKYASLNSILKGLYFDKNAPKSVNVRAIWDGMF